MPNLFKRRHTSQGRHTPNLRSIWLVAPLALIAVGLLAFALYQGADALLTSENMTKTPVDVQDVIKTTVTVITLMGAVLAGVYAYRKQLLAEGDSHRADASQLAERYGTAAEQLGHEQAAVRLAGAYALARLADDWPEQRQMCVDVLCAYLRMPYEANATSPGFRMGEREVRRTIVELIRNHLQDPSAPTTWCGLDLDFTSATFDSGADFRGAQFTGGNVSFQRVRLTGAGVSFGDARFAGSTVSFMDTKFTDGGVSFIGAEFTGGVVSFYGSEFSGSTVIFSSSTFSGGRVSFQLADFCGSEIIFGTVRISGGLVLFDGAKFNSGTVQFGGTRVMSGGFSFGHAEFAGSAVFFTHAQFRGGEVGFADATLTGGTVSFEDASVGADAFISWGPFTPISST
ncbi:pentapeptide repeat-containing protein [Streptomyces aureus]|uniref:Pentapeptide repeat-containing protein n=1 Tax=Streptomyces aureus TaxID=193461 RepID=A0ABV4SQB3_9ACTN